jgi:hypothetical protein
MSVQIEEELETLLVMQVGELTANLNNTLLEDFVWITPSTIHIVPIDITTEVTVNYSINVYHWKNYKVEAI